MNYSHYTKTILLLMFIVTTLVGCKSKQDKAVNNAAVPQQDIATQPAALPQKQSSTPAVSPQDKADAQAAATQVLALMESGDFSSIYKNAAAEFKQIGIENQFVAKFQQTRNNVGILKNPKEISFVAVPGNGLVFVYRLENERYKSDLRLTFTRAKSGKMELAGLNQHDDLKK